MSAHDQAGGTIAPQSCKSGMVASAPYSSAHDDIRGNRGCYEGCVVVSRQLSGSDYDARTSSPDDEKRLSHDGSNFGCSHQPTHTHKNHASPGGSNLSARTECTDDES